MREATAPQPALPPGGEDRLLAASERVLAALAEDRQLLLRLIAGHGELRELLMRNNRIADAQVEWRAGIAEIRAGRIVKSVEDLIAVPPPPAPPVPVPSRGRHQARRRRAPGEGQLKLLGVAAAAFAGLRHALHLHYPAAVKVLGLHSAKAALAATAGTAAGTALVVGAVVTLTPPSSHPGPGGASAGTVPGWHTSATPIPSPSLTGSTARPQADAGKARRLAALPPVPPVLPSWSSPSSQPSPLSRPTSSAASPAAGPAVLTVSTTAIDLTGATPAILILSASGTGWVSWSVTTTGTDLAFSRTAGVLAAGQSYQLTVSLDASQDGSTVQVFEIGGQQVTAALPAPVPSAAVTPASAAPSPAAS